jgi:hypothetical protein
MNDLQVINMSKWLHIYIICIYIILYIYMNNLTGNYYEYKAMALGGRSQSAKTYLEKHFEQFTGGTLSLSVFILRNDLCFDNSSLRVHVWLNIIACMSFCSVR